jgi:hypothetical protein
MPKRTPLLVAALFSLMACEKDADHIAIPFEKKFVIESYLSPQAAFIEVRVGQNQPTVGPGSAGGKPADVTTAVVELADGARRVVLPFVAVMDLSGQLIAEKSSYRVPAETLPIRPGQTYTLRVTAPGFTDAEATCTIPARAVDARAVRIIRGSEPLGGLDWEYFQAVFDDFPGEENYYSTYLAMNRTELAPGTGGPPTSTVNTRGTQLISDERNDGGTLRSERAYRQIGERPAPGRFVTHQLELIIATTDRPYYEFNRTLRKQGQSDGNPFAEPVLVYSNVRGGLGVFAGYQRSQVLHTL